MKVVSFLEELIDGNEMPRCGECLYFGWTGQQSYVSGKADMGHCRRHAPSHFERDPAGRPLALWPMVIVSDFCGEWVKDRSEDNPDA